jgi:hypothetical protein
VSAASDHHDDHDTKGASVSEEAARLASLPSAPDDLREQVSEALAEWLSAAAGLEQLELDGIEPAPSSPVWR